MSKDMDISRKEAAFARAALRGILSQYKATLKLQKSCCPSGQAIVRVPLPPQPISEHPRPSSFRPSKPDFDGHNVPTGTSQPASSTSDNHPTPSANPGLALASTPAAATTTTNAIISLLKSASLIQRLWHLVANIRLVAIVRKIFSYVPFVKAPSKLG
ncbi:hypothetical protein TEA_018106 [Camellia sinensis var. sinensis]|uniref:Uncharacterized protein n=1 Tax=Camellia sinensis var. sinensis TaxID=542762 RepID=A0A4S4DBY9_CAMSN|nr:hypothetical protein TEA_018106 [Camellia sinensis var. sinensis]